MVYHLPVVVCKPPHSGMGPTTMKLVWIIPEPGCIHVFLTWSINYEINNFLKLLSIIIITLASSVVKLSNARISCGQVITLVCVFADNTVLDCLQSGVNLTAVTWEISTA